MFETIRNYWRSAAPGVGSIIGFSLWGWEQRFTNEPNAQISSLGLYMGLFFMGWFFGLVWADQTKTGSYARQRLARKKVIEPFVSITRVIPVEAGSNGQPSTEFKYLVNVGIITHKFKDFENVSAIYTIKKAGVPIRTEPIVENKDVNRNVQERKQPLTLMLPVYEDEVRYQMNDPTKGQETTQLLRGDTLEIVVEATAKKMHNQTRTFTIGAKIDPADRMFFLSSDQQFAFFYR